MQDAIARVEAAFLPRHRKAPLAPSSGPELAAVVDLIVAADDFDTSYATVVLHSRSGSVTVLGVGVSVERGTGAVHFRDDEGECYTKGADARGGDVFFCDYGNARYFPPDSEVGLDQVKQALAECFDRSGARPSNVRWQVWEDPGF